MLPNWTEVITGMIVLAACAVSLPVTLGLKRKIPPPGPSCLRGGILLFAACYLLILLLRGILPGPSSDPAGPEEPPGTTDTARKHPMEDPNFPYPVQVMVGDEERPPRFHDGKMYIALDQGEVYWVRIEKKTPEQVLMRLLIDGRNTQPEEVVSKSLEPTSRSDPETKPERPELRHARIVSPDEARPWILRTHKAHKIEGFYTRPGKEAESLDQFLPVLRSCL